MQIETNIQKDNGIMEFIRTQVNIDLIENNFGHYPFQLKYTCRDTGKIEIAALALNGIADIMSKVNNYIHRNYEEILFSLDYPSAGDMENDFIVVFSIKNKKLDLLAIQYDTQNGNVLKIVEENVSNYLSEIAKQIRLKLSLDKG